MLSESWKMVDNHQIGGYTYSMRGYHYTTRRVWSAFIQHEGLTVGPIRHHELEEFRREMPDCQEMGIWVWKEIPKPEQAWIITALLATMHNDWDLVLLEVEYDETETMLYQNPYPGDDRVKQTCQFSACHLDTGRLEIDILVDPVPATRITKIWEANLLSPLQVEECYV